MEAYKNLEEHIQLLSNLEHLGAVASWDESVMMPSGGGESRAEALGALDLVCHSIMTDPEIGELIAAAECEELDDWQMINLQLIKKDWLEATSTPADLLVAVTTTRMKCEQAWRTMRADNNWKEFAPLLEETFGLVKQLAEIRGELFGLSVYDALIDYHDPGTTSEKIDPVFEQLKSILPDMIQEIVEKQKSKNVPFMNLGAGPMLQHELGLALMDVVGFDKNRGRLDVSHHPFCGGVSDDVRITTRYLLDDFTSSMMSVLHEAGHAKYEQGLPKEWRNQPVGGALGMSVHESQSLFLEFQVCRSKEFLNHVAPLIQTTLGKKNITSDMLHDIYTMVEPGYIRVEADEVTYPLHVILRYEIEKKLFNGELTIADIPEAWNSYMTNFLGLSTDGEYEDGCMQDVHWPSGGFGYFPSYTLGAIRAAQFMNKISDEHSDLMDNFEKGDFSQAFDWLTENVHSVGRSLNEEELMIKTTGETLNSKYFLEHLNKRYLS